LLGTAYYLIADSGREVFIRRDDAANDDDRLRVRLGNTFRVQPYHSARAWERAQTYLARDTTTPIEIATDNLLKTKAVADTNAVAYTVTRVELDGEVEFQIICTSRKQGFKDTYVASLLAFYMYTGRTYVDEY
jgi:hypothetical protein